MPRLLKAVLAMGLCLVRCARAQTDYSRVRGPVVVWIVAPATEEEKARAILRKQAMARALPTTVQQSTTGEFGQPASNVGQSAGSYGQSAGSMGQNASDTGKPASEHGQSAGSFGKPASEHGQSAGSYGQSAGSFGGAASSNGAAATGTGLPGGSRSEMRVVLEDRGGGLRSGVRYVDVLAENLRDSLLGAQGTDAFPDVVVGALPAWWDESGWGVAMLGSLQFRDIAGDSAERLLSKIGRAVVMLHAPHPEQARAYVLWLREGDRCGGCVADLKKEWQVPEALAVRVVGRVLNGNGLGVDADEDAAPFSAELAQRMALAPLALGPLELSNDVKFRCDVQGAGVNERLAVVIVQAVVDSKNAFGAGHAVVVMRKDAHDRWKVLQISSGVSPQGVGNAGGDLMTYARDVAPEKLPHVVGVSQASPVDGDLRPLQPDLWWDNGGGATMQVVEWQKKIGAWSDTHLMLVPDNDFRVQTRVTARFANSGGEYRWRVWSVGEGGVMVISPWKTLKILP